MYSRAGCYTNSYPLLPTKSESVVEIKTQGAPINVPTHDAEMMSKVTIKPSPVSNSIISVQTISIGAIVLIFLMVFSGLLIYVFKKTIKERLYEYGVLSTGKNYQNTEPENVTLRNADLQSDEFVNQTSV